LIAINFVDKKTREAKAESPHMSLQKIRLARRETEHLLQLEEANTLGKGPKATLKKDDTSHAKLTGPLKSCLGF
jgi:hypothetical protein